MAVGAFMAKTRVNNDMRVNQKGGIKMVGKCKVKLTILGVGVLLLTLLSSVSAASPVTIRFITLGGVQNDIMDEMVETFEAENPGIRVEWENWPYMDAYNKYVTITKGGNPPDCGYTFDIMLPEFVERGVLVPVEDYISEDLKNDYYEAILERSKYDGKLWALPAWFSTNLITYRKDILDAQGLKVPTTPEESLELVKALHNPPDMYGAAFPGGQNPTYAVRWFSTQLWGRGGRFLTEDGRKAAFNSKAGIEALEYLTELVPYYQPGFLSHGEHELARIYSSGKISWMQWSMGGSVLTPKKEHPDWEFVSNCPPTPEKVSLGIVDHYFIFKTTPERQQAAYKWLEFTQRPEYTEHTNIDMGFLPTRKSAAEYYMSTDFFKNHPEKDDIEAYINAAEHVKWPPYSPKWYEIEKEIQEAIQLSFTGRLTPEKALDQAASRVNRILDDFYK
jgi:multiple sugar transport system substrate-binding protein